jgi:hypothetical protein
MACHACGEYSLRVYFNSRIKTYCSGTHIVPWQGVISLFLGTIPIMSSVRGTVNCDPLQLCGTYIDITTGYPVQL